MSENTKEIRITGIESEEDSCKIQDNNFSLDDIVSRLIQRLSNRILNEIEGLDVNKCLEMLIKLLERSGKMNTQKDNKNEPSAFSTVTDEELNNLVANIVNHFNRQGGKGE